MFFVAKEKIGTVLGAQKEYSACGRRGISFVQHSLAGTQGHSVWHYLWPVEMVEPSIRARFEPEQPAAVAQVPDEDATAGGEGTALPEGPTHVIWSRHVAPGEVIGEPVITPFSGEADWIAEAKSKFDDAQRAAG